MHSRRYFLVVAVMVATMAGCRRGYDQSTPQAVLQTAKKMVEKGDADRLPELLYADTPQMRQLLDDLGIVLGSLQDLANAVQKAYPEEIDELKKQAEESAKQGDASGFLMRIAGQASQQAGAGKSGGRRPLRLNVGAGGPGVAGQSDPEAMRGMFDNAMKELFADPYGWIAANETRLTAQQIADDRAAILWDGKPVLGIGLTMQKDVDDRWYVVLPLNAPGVGQFMPKTPESWEIMGSLMTVFDNMLQDLTTDVRRGRAARLDDLARMAGEKAFLPAVMVFFAYSKSIEVERKAAREAAKPPSPTPSSTAPPVPPH
jgi:hypothetical protein